ncbi:MAG: acetyltransferase [Candidatus Omnitrophica bacterium]|nr:acetyltransferase [Candidatus Omnitrophota bacterium]
MADKIILVGGGGHCKVVIDAIQKSGSFEIYGIADSSLPKDETVLGIKVLGDDTILEELLKDGIKYAFISVGSIGNCGVRKKIYENLKDIGFELPVIIHPNAVKASDVETGEGTFVAAGAVINPGTKIGKNVIINTRSSVDHDCAIGDFVHIAPGAILSGGVKVGDEAHIGTGAKVIQSLEIGKRAFICAGITITRNIDDEEKAK